MAHPLVNAFLTVESDEEDLFMKQSLVITSFGTSIPEARRGIEAVEDSLKEAAGCDYSVVRAFTSPTIRRILKERGEQVFSLPEALAELHQEGVGRVVVQPTHLLYGYEYDKLKAAAEEAAEHFAELIVGKPLLANNQDILQFANKIAATHSQQDKTAVVYMGHGTEHFANAVYPALQTAFHLAGRNDIFIGTVEGWPGLKEVLSQLQEPCTVKLLPLMLVAGDHARNDMAINWKKELERAGHSVQCEFTGLGELPWIQEMYRDRLLPILR